MGRSLGSASLQMISPQKAWLEPDVGVGGMSRTSCNTCEIADKLQKVHLGGHGEATRMTSRRARIKSRGRSECVEEESGCTLRPCLATCEASCSRACTWLALPPVVHGSAPAWEQTGVPPCQAALLRKASLQIHSMQASYKSDEQAQPLFDYDGVLTQMREIEKYLTELHDDIKEVEEAPSATSMSSHLLCVLWHLHCTKMYIKNWHSEFGSRPGRGGSHYSQ